jgi:Sulfotransferase family
MFALFTIVTSEENNSGSNNRNRKEIWPNFFIVGAPRAATTSLYAYLKVVSGIYLPDLKEPHYFASKRLPDRLFGINLAVIRSKSQYLNLFNDVKNEKAIGDASTSYLYDPDTPKLIHDSTPRARIIMILRDPIERAFSHYLMHLRDGSETNLSFYDALKNDYDKETKVELGFSHLYIGYGLYSEQVKRYLDIFGREQVKVIIFEEFVKDIKDTVRDVLRFLSIDDSTKLPENILKTYNSYLGSRFRYLPFIISSVATLKNRIRTRNNADKNMTRFRQIKSISVSRTEMLKRKILFSKSSKPRIQEEARVFLNQIYCSDVMELQQILGRTLPWSLASQDS